jgi:hypothetical protein
VSDEYKSAYTSTPSENQHLNDAGQRGIDAPTTSLFRNGIPSG